MARRLDSVALDTSQERPAATASRACLTRVATPGVCAAGYSKDLQNLIGRLLTTEPSQRPTVDQILRMDCILSRMSKLPNAAEAIPSTARSDSTMVGTIRVPYKMRGKSPITTSLRARTQLSRCRHGGRVQSALRDANAA